MTNGTDLYGCGFTSIVAASSQSTSAPYCRMVQMVRSMYGRENISPLRCSVSPFIMTGPIISSAETYCEDTLPAMSRLPPTSLWPRMRSGGNPRFSTYSMSAPSRVRASTSTPMGRWRMRSVPVMTCSPSVEARKAVVKRIAVPAALIFISYGMSRRAATMTSVSSHLLRFSGRCALSASALMASARLLMLFEAGRFISQLICFGA